MKKVNIELFENEVRLLMKCCHYYDDSLNDSMASIQENQSDIFEECLREQYKVREIEDKLILLLDDFYK